MANGIQTIKLNKLDLQIPLNGLFPDTLDQRKTDFLNLLRSPSDKAKFKRYSKTPLRYAGGKTLAVGLIIEKIPTNIKRLVSPFFGGGSVEVACALELGIPVVGYDVFDILTNYWQIQLKSPGLLSKGLLKFAPTRKGFVEVKEKLKKHWKNESKLDPLNLAAHYYFNHNTSYGPHFLGSPSSVYLQEQRYKKMVDKVANFKVPNMQVKCASFEKIIPKHNSDFLYCDPPYYLDGDSKTFVGMYPHRNFPIHHKGFDHKKLSELLKKHKGGFVLSYNDCSMIREWYKEFDMSTPKWQYTFSQGDTRIGENRLKNNNGSHVKKSHELLIWRMPK